MRALYFSVGPKQLNYPPGEPLKVAYITAGLVATTGLGFILVRLRTVWRTNYSLQLFLIMCSVYVVVLFLQNLSDYLELGVPVAVQGRYLVPILIPLLCLAVVAARSILRRVPVRISLGVLAVLLLLTLDGGGVSPYIIRSADNWMWNEHATQQVTRDVRSALWPVITR